MKYLSDIETPCVIVDRDRLQDNIQSIQGIANTHKINLRPHIKTHKCPEIAKMQIKEGAVGITASKTGEAVVFMENQITSSVTIAYPLIVESKLDGLLKSSRLHNIELRLMADSEEGINIISRSAIKKEMKIGVFLKIDVGLHRCGVQENEPILMELVQKIVRDSSLNFLGLLSHAGNAYAKKNRSEVLEVALEEHKILSRVRQTIEKEGIAVNEVSVGSTPTVLASNIYDGITEIRPGNYVFMDRTPLRLGLIKPEQIALTVLATVVSRNSDYFIIDAGSKVLSSDLGAHGTSGGTDYGLVYPLERFQQEEYEMKVMKLSEEHGFVARGKYDLKIGDKMRIIPNHACAVANLADSYSVVENDQVVDQWKIEARGKVL